MRILLFFCSFCLGATVIATHAQAQNFPWCAQYSKGGDEQNCGFVSFEQCMETVRGIGGFCVQNNTYQSPPGPHRQQNSSIYVAGKGKYCKESPVAGYLDCFYASSDACKRHNKSTTLRCVANPNSGT